MADIDLVVTDLDGTFWESHATLSPALREAWDEVARRVPVLVATGRRVTSTRESLAALGLAPAAVVLNGALTLDLATGNRYHRAPFRTDQATAVLAAFQSVGLDPCVYVDGWPGGAEVLLSATPSTNPGHVASLGGWAATVDLVGAVPEAAVLGFSIIGAPWDALSEAAAVIGERAEVHLDRAFEYDGLAAITVAPKGQSKWDGVVAYCRLHDLDPARVLAVADGPNDVELLTNAAVRVVPEVAHPSARQLADYTIPAAVDCGWARLPALLEAIDRTGSGRLPPEPVE